MLPHSKGGLVGAVMLGLGRAMGETIAAALVIGSSIGQITINPFASGNSMPAVIANEWGEADELHKSALIALAVDAVRHHDRRQPDRHADRAAARWNAAAERDVIDPSSRPSTCARGRAGARRRTRS